MRHFLIYKAMDEAEKSNNRFRMGSIIFDKKNIISSGHNCSFRSAKHLHPNFQKRKNSIHAEVDAIIKARTNIKGFSLIVVRLSAKGKLTLAKPCNHCMMYIEYVGIKNVFYSNKKGEIERIKL